MEDEKKKKKNKKKKNKQTKNVAEEVVVGRGETSSVDQNHHGNGKEDQGQVFEAADIRNDVHEVDADLHRHQPNGTECSSLAESEKQKWLQRVATLEEIIKQLRTEKNLHIQKEASLENTIEQLQKENNSHLQKEATFEDAVKQLQDENNSHLQKAASLEMKIRQLQDEKDSLLQKEVGLEEKINRLTDEKITWDLKEVSLQERIKHLEGEKDSLMLKEDITKESIANLNHDIARLRVQVVELEESRNNVLQENQLLVARLQLQIKDFETISSTQPPDEVTKQPSELEDLNSQVEAACALVEKLITENADLVEKVNELYVELDRHTAIARLSSTASAPDPMSPVTTSVLDHLSPINENTVSISIQKSDSVEGVPVKEERNSISKMDSDHADEILRSSTSDASSEIVQIPLDENVVRDLELQVAETDTEAVVPLSEAPLIGAPFRLVSFVTRYVSGADLVNRNSFGSSR